MKTQTIPSPWGGYDTETTDGQLAANKCRLLKNMLPGRPGKVVLRGPLRRARDTDSAAAGASTTFSGGWVFGDTLLHADMDTNPVGYMVTDWAPTNPTLSTKVNPASLNVGLYPFHARGGDFVYGYTAGSAGAPAAAAPNRRTSGGSASASDARLLRWDGGVLAGSFSLYTATSGPVGAVDIRTFLNRLFILGGSVPGTTTPVYTTRLYWSADLGTGGAALPDATSSFQSGGVTNQIVLEGTANDYGVGMAILNGRLVILRRQSLYMMTGTSPENFLVRKIASVGCVDPGSILEWDNGVYFISDTGLVFFDGSSIEPISGPIAGELAANSWQGATASEVSIARVSSEHFMMAATGSTRKCWLYHVPSRSWAEVTASTRVIAGAAPSKVMRVTNYPLVYDGTYIYDSSFLTLPEAADANTAAGRDANPRDGGNMVPPAEMLTRTFRLAAPEQGAALHKALLDYALKSPPGVTTGTLEWDISIEDGRGNVLMSSPTISPLLADYAGGEIVRVPPKRRREIREAVILESDEIAIRWTLNAASPAWPAYCEVQDSALQYEPTHDRY